MKKQVIAACILGASMQVDAGGYRVSLQGQKALGMGHTGVAMSLSSESVFFNPGAITQLEGSINLSAGINLLESENRYQNTSTNAFAKTNNSLATPVNFYGTWQKSDKLALGLGIYTPYGSAVNWDTDWVGSHLVNNIDLRAIFVQPTVAYAFNEQLSVGVGPIMAIGAVELNRNLSTSLQDSDGNRSNVTIKDTGIVEFGYNLGVFYRANKQLNIGLNYRSEIIMNSEGRANFANVPGALDPVFSDGGYKAELPLPAEFTLGMSYMLNEQWTIAADYNYSFWDTYEDLTVQFDSINDPNRALSVSPRDYKNSSIYRLGVQFQHSKLLALRGGIYRDETPIRDGYFAPETPRSDAFGLTAGLSYAFSDAIELDASLLYLYFSEEENSYDFSSAGPFEGTYKVNAFSLGFGITYKI